MLPGILGIAGMRGAGPIQFVGGATAAKVGATSGNSTIALNGGLTGGIASAVQDGDFVIAAFASASESNITLAITDGTNAYTLIGSELWADDFTDTNLRVAYKFAAGDTAATFGPTGDAAWAAAMAVYVFRNVNSSTPLDVAVTTATSADSLLANPPSITPSTPGAFIVAVGACGTASGANTFTSSDLTAFLTQGSNDDRDATIGIGHKPDWVSGAFDPAAFGYTGSDNTSSSWAAMSIALRPA
jgi:hypothetical protein